MERVIVAFDSEKIRTRVRDMLERRGINPSGCVSSAAHVRRLTANLGGGVIVCGERLSDISAFELSTAVHECALILVVASPTALDRFDSQNVFKLAMPTSCDDLADSVKMLLRLEQKRVRGAQLRRTEDDKKIIESAKQLLIERN
ncbi:MAG: hypothetical protein RRY38_03405, partial [Oscillospiraceae bacterium]